MAALQTQRDDSSFLGTNDTFLLVACVESFVWEMREQNDLHNCCREGGKTNTFIAQNEVRARGLKHPYVDWRGTQDGKRAENSGLASMPLLRVGASEVMPMARL